MENKIFSLLNAMLDRKEATIEEKTTASRTKDETEVGRYISLYQKGNVSAQKCLSEIAEYMTYEESARNMKNVVLLKTLEKYFAQAKWGDAAENTLDDFHIKNPNDGIDEIVKMLRELADDIERFNKFKSDMQLNGTQIKETITSFNKHLTYGLLNKAKFYRNEAAKLEEVLTQRMLTPKEVITVIEHFFDVLYLNPRTYAIIEYCILLTTECDEDVFAAMANELEKELA